MKKYILVFLLVLSLCGFAFGQDAEDLELDAFKPAFEDFAKGVANTLPMASTIGLQWSDAYIRKLPHFGIGLSVGTAFMPATAFDTVLGEFGLPDVGSMLPAELPVQKLGLPFPAYSADFRLGGIVKPFDLGFKIGLIPKSLQSEMDSLLKDFDIDYLLIGGDFRYALMEQNKRLKPNLSVGIGYNYLRGGLGMPVSLGDAAGTQTFTAPDKENPTATKDYDFTLEDPKMSFSWQSHVIDLKAQVSKRILYVITPYVGVGASYGRSKTRGGLETGVLLDGEKVDDATITEIKEGFTAVNKEAPDLTADGIFVESKVNGWALRGFGGLSINIFFIKVDASFMYNLIDQSLGLQANLRLQF